MMKKINYIFIFSILWLFCKGFFILALASEISGTNDEIWKSALTSQSHFSNKIITTEELIGEFKYGSGSFIQGCLREVNELRLNKTKFFEEKKDKDTGKLIKTINKIWENLIQSQELINVRVLDVSHCQGVNKFLLKFINNPFLHSLVLIKANNSNISIKTANQFKGLISAQPLIRDMEKISERYDCNIVLIEVDIRMTPLAKFLEESWRDLRELEKPLDQSVATYYRIDPEEEFKAKLSFSFIRY